MTPVSSVLEILVATIDDLQERVDDLEDDVEQTHDVAKSAISKRWPEFATRRTDGSGVFMTTADLQTALTAELGKEPHRQTIKHVWEKLIEIGGSDIVEKTRQVGRDQTQTEILVMDMETANGPLEKRYVGLDLLENSDHKAATGGVTPVVVESSP